STVIESGSPRRRDGRRASRTVLGHHRGPGDPVPAASVDHMSGHGHSSPPSGAPVPEPSHAEQARTLVHLEGTGALGTLSRRHPGHPFVSVMPYAPDAHGRPLLLISRLAMHTQNLEADPRASLLVTQTGAGEDPLALARVTLMGHAARLDPAEREAARAS